MTRTLTFPLSTEHQPGGAGANYGASGIRTNSLRLDGNSLSHRSVSIITAQRIEISLEGWPNRFRRLLIRWEKKVETYVAMLHFACAWITFRASGVVG